MKKINENIFSDISYIEYQKEYFNTSNFTEILLKGTDNFNDSVMLPITIQRHKNIKNLNYYNNPIYLDDLNLNSNSYKNIIQEIKKMCEKEKVNSVLFKKKVSIFI